MVIKTKRKSRMAVSSESPLRQKKKTAEFSRKLEQIRNNLMPQKQTN